MKRSTGLWVATGAFLFLGCFATYQQNETARVKLEAPPAPVPTQSASPANSSPPVPAKPTPVPTVTVTVTQPPSDACKNAAKLALDLSEAISKMSGEYGDARLILNKATQAAAMGEQSELNKQLTKLQKLDDGRSEPLLELSQATEAFNLAYAECKKS